MCRPKLLWKFTKESWSYMKGKRWIMIKNFISTYKSLKREYELAEAGITIVEFKTRKQYVADRKAARKKNKELQREMVS